LKGNVKIISFFKLQEESDGRLGCMEAWGLGGMEALRRSALTVARDNVPGKKGKWFNQTFHRNRMKEIG